jgi:hypothetical protein
MQEFPINYLAVLVAGIARMALGSLWYSPVLFLKQWLRLQNMTPEDMKPGFPKAIAVDVVGSLVMAFVLVHAVHYAGAATAPQGAAVGFFNWLGFVAVVTLAMNVYERKPLALFFINNGFQLIALVIMGVILAVWV